MSWDLIFQHLFIVLAASLLSIAVGLPLGIWAYVSKTARPVILRIVDLLQTIPSLALLGIIMVVLDPGKLTVITGITLYSLLPIVRNTCLGLQEVDPGVKEAARGMGMSKPYRVLMVEFPLAFPTVFTGIRIAVVNAIGTAVFAAFVGGGGLGAGVALAIKTFKPEVRVIGAIPEGSPAWKNSLAAGHVVAADQVRTSAEGVAVKRPGDLTFALLNEFLDDIVTVTERDINEMILLMLEKHKLVVEAAGAVSLAALEHLNLRSRKFAEAKGPHVVVPIMSGGNEDTVSIGAVIQKGMITRGRIMHFEVELPDTPGQLVKVATLLAEQRANVIALDHDQFKASSHYANAVALGVTVETNGPDHIDRVLEALREAGFQPKRIY